ncbi:MAG: LacI family DNA-binding transcriptional regulator [Pseudomonadota bacterium]
MNRVTVIEVAELAGVSAVSVIEVANKEPNVRADTRRRVQAALRKLKYKASSDTRGDAERRGCVNG